MSKASLGSGSRRRGWAADTRSVILCTFDTSSVSSIASERNAEAGITKVVLDDDQFGQWKETTRRVVDDWVFGKSGEFDAAPGTSACWNWPQTDRARFHGKPSRW